MYDGKYGQWVRRTAYIERRIKIHHKFLTYLLSVKYANQIGT